jgi:hypothetical protein
MTTTITKADAELAKAQETLANLERDHAGAVARQVGLAKTREGLALAGLAGGAAADRKALEDATTEAGRLNLVVENLAFAITAARQESQQPRRRCGAQLTARIPRRRWQRSAQCALRHLAAPPH